MLAESCQGDLRPEPPGRAGAGDEGEEQRHGIAGPVLA